VISSNLSNKYKPLAAVILAAGKGTRLKRDIAKASVLTSSRKPLIVHVLEEVSTLGVNQIVIVVGHRKEDIIASCANFKVTFAEQVALRGTGDAVLATREALREQIGDVLITYGDVPLLTNETLNRFLLFHREKNSLLSVMTFSPKDGPNAYGRIITSPFGDVIERIVEARDATPLEAKISECNGGVYLVDKELLFSLLDKLTPSNSQGEYYLTDLVTLSNSIGVKPLKFHCDNEEELLGVNTLSDLTAVNNVLTKRHRLALESAEVIMEDAKTLFIDTEVEIGAGSIIGPNVILRGKTKVGKRVIIEGNAFLIDTEVGDDAFIKFSVRAENCVIGEGAKVGPFAHLRPESYVGKESKVGNFVELKKTLLNNDVSVGHLSYLGDTEVGEGSNIGAGTITCNYDGKNKHRTTIGKRTFIGSNTALIAPLRIGDDVTIGAGSVIQSDLPDGSLGLTRAPLKIKEKYTNRKE
jgi:bifunctional UDP-N-acetylglucosamine pyrophosphorylase/glucosamine-1-phosphate N-acetyltransferase